MVSVIWSTATRKREESVILQEPIHGNQYLTALPLESQIFIIPHTSSSCSLLSPAPKPAHTFHPTKELTGVGHLSSLLSLPCVTHFSHIAKNNTEQLQHLRLSPVDLPTCWCALSWPWESPHQPRHSSSPQKPLACPVVLRQLRARGRRVQGGAAGHGQHMGHPTAPGQAELRDQGGCSTRTWAPTVAPAP